MKVIAGNNQLLRPLTRTAQHDLPVYPLPKNTAGKQVAFVKQILIGDVSFGFRKLIMLAVDP
jgi:hypothetical protein